MATLICSDLVFFLLWFHSGILFSISAQPPQFFKDKRLTEYLLQRPGTQTGSSTNFTLPQNHTQELEDIGRGLWMVLSCHSKKKERAMSINNPFSEWSFCPCFPPLHPCPHALWLWSWHWLTRDNYCLLEHVREWLEVISICLLTTGELINEG